MSTFDLIYNVRALLAQLVEQLTLNQWVAGSNPSWRTNFAKFRGVVFFDYFLFLSSLTRTPILQSMD